MRYLLPFQAHDVTDTKLTSPDHRTVCAGVIPVHPNDSLHHFRIPLGCVWVKINHHTSLIPQRNTDCGHRGCPAIPFTKHQGPAHPAVFLKRLSVVCFNHNVWSKSAKIAKLLASP